METIFYDLYLEYMLNNKSLLQPIPVLFLDYKRNNKFVNKVRYVNAFFFLLFEFCFINLNNIDSKVYLLCVGERHVTMAAN